MTRLLVDTSSDYLVIVVANDNSILAIIDFSNSTCEPDGKSVLPTDSKNNVSPLIMLKLCAIKMIY